MGRRKRGDPPTKVTKATVAAWERRDLIRQLLLDGKSPPTIRRMMVDEGVRLPDARVLKVSADTFAKDLNAIAGWYRDLINDPSYREILAGGVVERLVGIAVKAEKAGKYTAAIMANRSVLDILGRLSPRWRSKGRGEDELISSVEEGVDALSDAELDEQIHAVRGRLIALEGGRDVIEADNG